MTGVLQEINSSQTGSPDKTQSMASFRVCKTHDHRGVSDWIAGLVWI